MSFLARCCVCAVFLLTSMPFCQADTPAQISARNKALYWLLTQQHGEGNWEAASGTGIIATSTVLDAYSRSGIKGYSRTAAVAWLANNQAVSTDALARQIVSLATARIDTKALITRLIAWRNDPVSNNPGLTWGSYDHYEGSFPDTALALDAIQITGTPYTANPDITFIQSQQNTDGGWPFSKNPSVSTLVAQSRLIPTAYNLLTLNGYKSIPAFSNAQTNINSGIAWLRLQQRPGGGFGEAPSGTVLETALAYLAISAELGVNDSAALSAQTYLLNQQRSSGTAIGSWAADPFVTGLVLQTLPVTTLADTDQDGVPDGVEVIAGTNPNLADSRYLAKGNGR